MRSVLNKISKLILNIVFPKSCIFCGRHGVLLCSSCEAELQINTYPLPDWVHTRYSYKDERVRKIIFKIKYNHTPELATEMGEYCKEYIDTKDILLIPVPISKDRLRKRDYNQALLFALGINKENTLDALERVKDTQRLFQTKHRDDRVRELADSFQVKTKYIDTIKNKNILIVDDITTTGATLYELRKVLQKAGAKKISAFTLAH